METVPEAWFRSYSPHAERLVLELLESHRPDVAQVHHWKRLTRNLVAVAMRRSVPCVVTLHDLFATCPKDFRLRDGGVCDEPRVVAQIESTVRQFPSVTSTMITVNGVPLADAVR